MMMAHKENAVSGFLAIVVVGGLLDLLPSIRIGVLWYRLPVLTLYTESFSMKIDVGMGSNTDLTDNYRPRTWVLSSIL